VVRQEVAHLRSRLPRLWSRSYEVGSAGQVCEETITRYIASQQQRA